ncbi:MAG TPA: SEC-C domain-containing protein [Oligoflexus sp.]|uniref:YecA family protein n=1 Tax=Oligoflexus sp. TaxID=1971216 RepID=UPI002D4F3783|nr:SEC-C domain-containing protein [Oligoflexus sp.]HYX37911.1 SEC-C domain-containing protein [Oligoflexus sp.]
MKRNALCRCGSGKKYKRCCLKNDEAAIEKMHSQVATGITQKLKHENVFGFVRPIVNCDFNGQKFIAVGSMLYWQSNWKTFVDFLFDFLKITMGADWWKKEFTKTIDKRNPMCKWATEMHDFERKYAKQEGDLIYLEPNGAMHAYLTLAYDLYVLQDNLKLQEEIIRRLKRLEHFSGARYELFVAATCIRAGFTVTHEDEADNSAKHPEFVARHKATGIEFDVEAKKRNRLLKLDFNDFHAGKARLDVRNILAGAINKFRNRPMIVFLDIDAPPLFGNAFTQPWSQELMDVTTDAGNRDGINQLF